MDDTPQTFQGLIARWPSVAQFGRDLGCDRHRGRIFWRRNRVPRRLWPALIAAAAARGFAVSQEFLEGLYQAGKGQGR